MTKYGKLMLAVSAAAMMIAGSGCGNHNSGTTTTVTTPTIIVYNGYRGYYVNGVFCDWLNNYCGTGNAYGIAPPVIIYSGGYYGYYDNNVFCDWTNDYCGTGISWGIIDNGTYCDYTYCGGTVSWGSTGSGSTGTGGTSGSTGTGGTSGSTGTGGTTTGSGSTGTGGTTTGSGSTGSTSYTGSTGAGGYTGGSTSGSTGSGSTTTTTSGSTGTTNSGAAFVGQTKDVDLQRAQLQIANIQSRAQALASQFGMSVETAVQVTQLADRMTALKSGGKAMTAEDTAALLDAAYGVAGVKGEQVNAAAAQYIKTGDQTAVNELLNTAAAHMGMSSTTALRDQILPSLGINLNTTK